jgi:hypothetical protein
MSIMTRILVLTVLSIAGIALLAPLAAQSAEPVLPDAVDDALLTEVERAPRADIARGDLSFRGGAVPTGSAAAEALDATPMPTPASAPMEATLHSAATPPPTPAPTPVPQPAARAPAPPSAPPASAPTTYSGDSVWDDLAQCESGGNWSINTGNGYYGGLQFSYGTWHDYGGGEFADYPHQATREEQIVVAERLRDARGYAPWPACRAKLGLP